MFLCPKNSWHGPHVGTAQKVRGKPAHTLPHRAGTAATGGAPLSCLERGSVLMDGKSLGSTVAASVGALWSFFSTVFLGDTTDNRWQIDPNGY
jgi:hypothetical protein